MGAWIDLAWDGSVTCVMQAVMPISLASNADIRAVVGLMRELSRQTDPQAAAALYGDGLRKLNLIPNDRYLSLSRRDLAAPAFRITRNSAWRSQPNPWQERDKLPLLSGGLLAEILYSNEPAIIDDLPARLARDDPAYEHLAGMQMLVALPHFDNGESINAGVLLVKDPATFPLEGVPMMIWQANQQFLLSSPSRGANASIELGIRYNFGSSIDKER